MKNEIRKNFLKAMKANFEYHEAIENTIEGINTILYKLFGECLLFVSHPYQDRPYELHLNIMMPVGVPYRGGKLLTGGAFTLYRSSFAEASLVKKGRCDLGHLITSIFALMGVHIKNDIDITVTSKNAATIKELLLNELSAS